MRVIINEKKYGFIWGTKCFIDTQKDLGIDVNAYMGSLVNPEVLTSLIYNGMKLWCSKNNEEMPFKDFDEFIEQYDSLFDEGFYQHIITDLLESMYMGQELHSYITKIYGLEFTDIEPSKEAKKKYLLTLEKSKLTSQVGATGGAKSKPRQSKSTKSRSTATK